MSHAQSPDSIKPLQEWWRGAVIYQIYPRSFLDSNEDGIGDLPGILSKLDYVASLGVDAIWLSPFFTSPMCDFGYDVADYCDVDPIFGALTDFDAIITKAHALGLKVIIDQVYSHTSDQHAWFQESRADRANPKANWYVWADPKADGAPPNNWQSVFGGPAWQWDSRRGQYYLHNFLTEQPDLNLHNMNVQKALFDVARFWLDRGVDGFRLDAINFAMHDLELRDNPAAPDDGKPRTRPFDFQLHTRNMSHPNIPSFLKALRSVTDGYGAIFTLAEVVGSDPLAEMKAFTAETTHLNSAYNFSFLYAEKITPQLTYDAVEPWRDDGWPSWAFSNHDAPRAVSRWADETSAEQAAKLYILLLMTLRGNPILYQGEELGLPQGHVPFEKLQDPEAIANWPLTLGRDGARTPIPWMSSALNAGFSGVDPWLPIDPRHKRLAVGKQEQDASSVLAFTRNIIALRRSIEALRSGAMNFIDAPEGVLAYRRHSNKDAIICVFNLTDQACKPGLGDAETYDLLASAGAKGDEKQLFTTLPPLSGYIAKSKAG